MEQRRPRDDGRDASGEGSDLVGPGTGGSPTSPDTDERSEAAAADPDVKELVDDLRADRDSVELDVTDAAEQTGTGTDR